MKRLAGVALVMMMAGSAAADISIGDDDRPRNRPAPTEEPAVDISLPSDEPATPPAAPVVDEKKGGCAARDGMSPEWMFGLAVLALGLVGVRRFGPRASGRDRGARAREGAAIGA